MTLLSIQCTAEVLQLAVKKYHQHKGADKRTETALREQIAVSIRFATNHMPGQPRWSKAVQELADQHGVTLNRLVGKQRKMRDAFPKGAVIFEHMVPVKTMLWAIINNPEDAEAILLSACTVWVTKEENDKLNELGYANDRSDPAEAYRQAGIELV